MNIDTANRWLSLLANIGVLGGFVLVAVQLNLNTDAIRLQTSISVNQQLISGEVAYMGETTNEAFPKALFDPAQITDEEVGQVWGYLNVTLFSAMNMWRAYKAGFATEEDLDYSIQYASALLGFRAGRQWWANVSSWYPDGFVAEIDERLSRSDAAQLEKDWRRMTTLFRSAGSTP